MDHVPFHEEVREFTQLVADACGPEYEVASEHAHSCCMLVRQHLGTPSHCSSAWDFLTCYVLAAQIGHVSMKRDGVFHTWIDYPKFHELIASGEQFTAADYMAPTPDWAIFNPVRACRGPYLSTWSLLSVS